jgi:hypothetical protein
MWPNLLTILLALFGIGARQLGLAVLMHEAAHRTLLADKKWRQKLPWPSPNLQYSRSPPNCQSRAQPTLRHRTGFA